MLQSCLASGPLAHGPWTPSVRLKFDSWAPSSLSSPALPLLVSQILRGRKAMIIPCSGKSPDMGQREGPREETTTKVVCWQMRQVIV